MNPVAAVLLKVTLLFCAGGVAAALLRHRSAAARHLVWMLSLAGALLLTVTSPLLPTIPLRIAGYPALATAPAASPAPGAAPAAPGATTPAARTAPDNSAAVAASLLAGMDFRDGLLALWLLGVLAVVGWCALGHAGLLHLQRRAVPLANAEWDGLASGIARRSGRELPVRVFRSRAVGSPVTWGARRPVVLLPDDAESWTAERRQVVLAHELAHAVRGDYLSQLIASLVCAVYWFHPLAWVAARRLRMESERACDDQVLLHGVPGVEYAAHLLDVARRSGARRPGGMVAIGMARPSQLEGRLLSVLDPDRARTVPRRRARITAWVGVALLIPPLSALRPAPKDVAITLEEPRAPADSSFTLSHAARAGEELVLDLESGGSVQIVGWDEPRVEVNARLGGASWRNTLVTLGPAEHGVRLHSWQARERGNSSTSHQFEIRVPRRYNVRLNSAGGGISIAGVEGEFSGQTGGGELALERTRGVAELSTGGGDVRVSDSELRGTVTTGGGSVNLVRVRGPLKGSSGSGPWVSENWVRTETRQVGEESAKATRELKRRLAELEKASGDASGEQSARRRELRAELERVRERLRELEREDPIDEVVTTRHAEERRNAEERRKYELVESGALRIRKAGGAIELEEAPDGAELFTGGGRIRVGAANGPIRVTTGGGDIVIGPAKGSVSATTGAGNVEITLVGSDGKERTVEVSSGNGSVMLELPPGFSGRFDLETAYTEHFGRRTRIESAWRLEQDETTEWDDRAGTPRKYVRAHGQIGDGGGLIKVRIVNGDIAIRRAGSRQ